MNLLYIISSNDFLFYEMYSTQIHLCPIWLSSIWITFVLLIGLFDCSSIFCISKTPKYGWSSQSVWFSISVFFPNSLFGAIGILKSALTPLDQSNWNVLWAIFLFSKKGSYNHISFAPILYAISNAITILSYSCSKLCWMINVTKNFQNPGIQLFLKNNVVEIDTLPVFLIYIKFYLFGLFR